MKNDTFRPSICDNLHNATFSKKYTTKSVVYFFQSVATKKNILPNRQYILFPNRVGGTFSCNCRVRIILPIWQYNVVSPRHRPRPEHSCVGSGPDRPLVREHKSFCSRDYTTKSVVYSAHMNALFAHMNALFAHMNALFWRLWSPGGRHFAHMKNDTFRPSICDNLHNATCRQNYTTKLVVYFFESVATKTIILPNRQYILFRSEQNGPKDTTCFWVGYGEKKVWPVPTSATRRLGGSVSE